MNPALFETTSAEPFRAAMASCWHLASHSHDPRTQNGAVLLRDLGAGHFVQVAGGMNHVPGPRGPGLDAVLADRALKGPRVVHAEVAALLCAARRGVETAGLTMVCPWGACLRCASAILEAGIVRLVVQRRRFQASATSWDAEVGEAHEWLHEAGVEMLSFEGDVGYGGDVLVNGSPWRP